MISNNKNSSDYVAKSSKKSGIILRELTNSGLESLSLDESSTIVGGLLTLEGQNLIKTDAQLQPQPTLQNVVLTPQNDRLYICAKDPTFC